MDTVRRIMENVFKCYKNFTRKLNVILFELLNLNILKLIMNENGRSADYLMISFMHQNHNDKPFHVWVHLENLTQLILCKPDEEWSRLLIRQIGTKFVVLNM